MAEIYAGKIHEKKLDTVLADDIEFEGDISFTKELMIKGKLKGTIKATGDLFIGLHAEVQAEISARSVIILGQVTGNITASKRVELMSSSIVTGDITAPRIVMETGCRFDGISRMTKEGK